jgi:hypothetical protein
MHPSNLVALVRDPEAVAEGLLVLHRLLPGANVSAIACAHPQMLRADRVASLQQVHNSFTPVLK